MLTAIAVGAIGIYSLVAVELASLHIQPMQWKGVLVGGVLFGIGIAIFGYCPGTGVAACGEGRKDAMVGVVGMLAGAWAYVWMYPLLIRLIRDDGDLGKITLPEVTGVPGWGWIVLVWLIALGVNVALPHSRPVRQDQPEKTALQ